MADLKTRRGFLRTAHFAAAVALPLGDALFQASRAEGQSGAAAVARAPFQVFTAQMIAGSLRALDAAPGNKDLINAPGIGVSANLTVEGKKSGVEFEFHAHKDHIFQVLEGNTRYLVGGTPQNARLIKEGDWLAPDSVGFTTVEMKKGDILSVPRMTPHKRVTEVGVSLLQINGIMP